MSGLMPASETESSFADAERAAFIRYRTPDLLCGWARGGSIPQA
jgi:hypothetical protein